MDLSKNVFLFVPNIIGYVRIILLILSCYFMHHQWTTAVFCYIASVLLDAVDGHAARYFSQTSQFGAILDQLTDRYVPTSIYLAICNVFQMLDKALPVLWGAHQMGKYLGRQIRFYLTGAILLSIQTVLRTDSLEPSSRARIHLKKLLNPVAINFHLVEFMY